MEKEAKNLNENEIKHSRKVIEYRLDLSPVTKKKSSTTGRYRQAMSCLQEKRADVADTIQAVFAVRKGLCMVLEAEAD